MTRSKPPRETPDVAKGVARMVRALGRRVGDEDPIDLQELHSIRVALDEAEREAVGLLRSKGCSWADIGEGLGTTRQNAQQRFTNRKVVQ